MEQNPEIQANTEKEASPTAYDDSFRTLLNDCKELIIPVINEVFGENYTVKEQIELGINENIQSQSGDKLKKVITDSSLAITTEDGKTKRYHLECQARDDSSMLVRIYEYDARIALADGSLEDDVLTVNFPKSAVIFLRHTSTTPDHMRIRLVTPEGSTEYTVPVVKVQQYSLEDIFSKGMLFFLPFYIFCHENQLPEYESDEEKFKTLMAEYAYIQRRMEELQKAGEITEFVKKAICITTNHVMKKIAEKYRKVREGVEQIMGGQVLEYEAKTILNDGISIGRTEGIGIGRDEERKLAQAETEERAKDMLRDRMELSLVEKYTHLSMPRIQELARGLGML